MNFIHFEKIDSTNSEALRLIGATRNVRQLDQTVIAAYEQSAGRGRLKRAFYSPAKSGIYFTAIHAPKNPIQAPAKLTAAAAVAVCRSLEELFNVEPKIKWVNDIYVAGKKVCGLLAEGHIGAQGKIDAAAIGIGINIYPSDFPAEIADRAGAVLGREQNRTKGQEAAASTDCASKDCSQDQNFAAPLGQEQDCSQAQEAAASTDCKATQRAGDIRLVLARDVSQKLFDLLQNDEQSEAAWEATAAEYAERSFIIGKEITVVPVIGDERSAYPATVLGIDKEARLLVRLDDGSERALSSGEISIRL